MGYTSASVPSISTAGSNPMHWCQLLLMLLLLMSHPQFTASHPSRAWTSTIPAYHKADGIVLTAHHTL